MICRILLLITLTCCVCGTFVVKVTQSSYQAEEKHNVTLEWTFPVKPHTSPDSLFIFCEKHTEGKTLFLALGGVEVPEYQHEEFAGRVQCEKDVLRGGRIRLHVSRLRTDDSGSYRCEVRTNDGVDYAECRLDVTAAADETKPPRSSQSPEPEILIIIIYAGLAAALLLSCVGLCFAFRLIFIKRPIRNTTIVMSSLSEEPSGQSEGRLSVSAV